MPDDELEELRQQTRGTDRIDAGDGAEETSETSAEAAADESRGSATETAGAEVSGPEPQEGFAEDFASNVGSVQRGIRPKSFSASDPALSAFFETLANDEDAVQEVGDALAARVEADFDGDGYTKSELVRLSVLAGVHDAAPEYYEELDDAVDR